ncbi:MAG: protein-L-isoaspartate(D-aspartate) O-methyltransferase [Gammaproteobacteria bacterium]|nr:protein-L-isoaspartate(D-aspartate) O-methyltransferase [Gammaproteobacteria bacterium]
MKLDERQRMIDDIEYHVRYTRSLIGTDALNERVMEAMRAVPRHEFVPPDARAYAYANGPAPIGHGQTISQPYIVALMTDLLNPGQEDVVLEVGSGSGYQAAVLSLLVRKVYSIEVIEDLAQQATRRLARLGYTNVEISVGDGHFGYPEKAPFDGIVVTAAASHIPPALVNQLKEGARLVIPVGLPFMPQELMVVEKGEGGTTTTRDVLGVAFVPLVDKGAVHKPQ